MLIIMPRIVSAANVHHINATDDWRGGKMAVVCAQSAGLLGVTALHHFNKRK